MANYYISNQANATPALTSMTTTYKTLSAITANTAGLKRFKIYDIMMGTNGTPADNYVEFDVARQTAAGTGVTGTITVLDPADGAPSATALINETIEPTYTGTTSDTGGLFYIAINQRASFRWVAAPGSELVCPATTANGLGHRAKSAAYTSTCGSAVYFSE